MSGAMLRVYMESMLQVLGESKRSQGRSALYADACQQIADAIRVRCNQLSVLCGRLTTTGVGDPSENATCFAALSACTWIDGHLAGLERSALRSIARPDSRRIMSSTKRCWTLCPATLPSPSEHPEAYGTLRSVVVSVGR